jgi:hypothetical protein
MTNFDYIKSRLTELDLCYYEFPHEIPVNSRPELFSHKIYDVFRKWAESASGNHGNMSKGEYPSGKVVKENPSIWAWEFWHYPDGSKKRMGRNNIIAFQVWLGMQYDEKEWENV